MESLAPVLVDEMELLVDLMPADTHVLVLDPERARSRAPTTWSRPARSSWAPAGPRPPAAAPRRSTSAPRRTARSPTSARTPSAGQAWWTLRPFGIDDRGGARPSPARRDGRDRPSDIDARSAPCRAAPCAKPAEAYRGDIEQAVGDIRGWLGDGSGCRCRPRRPRTRPADGRGARRARRRRPAVELAGRADPRRGDRALRLPHHGFVDEPTGSCSSPATTSRARRPRPATCARCRRAASGRSTRSS